VEIALGHWKRYAIGAVIIILLSAIATATTILLEVKQELEPIFPHGGSGGIKAIPGVENVLKDVDPSDPQTVLLLGSDHRYFDTKADPPRSDTMIVVHLDPDQHATAVMSIPRDLKVDVPGHGTQKINAAYHLGGEKLTVSTLESMGIFVSHVISVEFGGFRRAVDRLGCVYADIDRRYFNDNTGPEPDYAVIDIKPGYQKLCGQNALDYVRYRHTDSDFVRAARQQAFLAQAKDQIGVGKLLSDRKQLLRIFARYTSSDIANSDFAEILGLLKLVYLSTREPVTEIKFPATDCPDRSCVEISPELLAKTVARFEAVKGKEDDGSEDGGGEDGAGEARAAKQPAKRIRAGKGLAPGLINARKEAENVALQTDLRLAPYNLPVYVPRVRLARGGFVTGSSPRSYEIFDRDKKRHRAYRIVLSTGLDGEYYGIQGTTWRNPPILDHPTDDRKIGNHTFQRYFDGKRIRLMAFRTPKAVYWVSNTLTEKLTNRQMIDIAGSLRLIG
jgi:LCP family protein required for cell wall assembly